MSLAIASGFWPRPSRLSRPLLTASRKKKIVIHSFGSPLALATLALRCAFGRLCRLAFPFFIIVIIIMLWRAALPAFRLRCLAFVFCLRLPTLPPFLFRFYTRQLRCFVPNRRPSVLSKVFGLIVIIIYR